MNRTFLIFLMIGTAMMITVIGQHEEASQLDTMPWEVDRLENGSLRVFGITLGKTSIQEANQLFARFGENQFQVKTGNNDKPEFELYTLYDELAFGGLIASLKLNYQIDQKDLELIYQSLTTDQRASGANTFSIDKDTQIKYLSSPVSSVTYIPSIDYDPQTIRQNFGQPTAEKQVDDELQIWSYAKMGLQIYIYKTQADQFIYTPLK